MATKPQVIPLARAAAAKALIAQGVPPHSSALDAALLAVTELATNTVRHATGANHFYLTLAVRGGHAEVAVQDSHPQPTALPPRSSNGGLALLADLAHDFGGRLCLQHTDTGSGKTIRILLPLT